MWHPEIFQIQDQRDASPEATTTIRRSLVNVSLNIFNAVGDGTGCEYEIWLDYNSVPQWSPLLSSRILFAIPHIYRSATFTAVQLADSDLRTIQFLDEGKSTREHLDDILGICNTAWFRRVWTASEFASSPQVRVPDIDHQLLGDPDDPSFNLAMMKTWDQELTQHRSHTLERMAGHGKNLVPWSLSALFHIKQLRLADFGHAFSMLSSRACATKSDFRYALNGIVKSQADLTLCPDPDLAYIHIAKNCLENGDYSPLIMNPRAWRWTRSSCTLPPLCST